MVLRGRCCGAHGPRRRGRLLALALLAAAVAAPAAPAAPKVMSGQALLQGLRAGPVQLDGYRITGDVDLSRRNLVHQLACRHCRFDGGLTAARSNVVWTLDLEDSAFTGKVDLSRAHLRSGLLASGAVFHGIVDLRGGTAKRGVRPVRGPFDAPVLLSDPPAAENDPTTFGGPVDFSLASFASLATFEYTVFRQGADFSLARFGGDVVFANGESVHSVGFRRAVFLGTADFSNYTFDDGTSNDGARFAAPADFSQASFCGTTSFNAVRFGQGASFTGTTYPKQTPDCGDDTASFVGVESDGDLNFAYSNFGRKGDFEDLVAKGLLSFADAKLQPGVLHFFHVAPGGFAMSVGGCAPRGGARRGERRRPAGRAADDRVRRRRAATCRRVGFELAKPVSTHASSTRYRRISKVRPCLLSSLLLVGPISESDVSSSVPRLDSAFGARGTCGRFVWRAAVMASTKARSAIRGCRGRTK